MKIIRAKELTMPLTAGEEADCSTEQWAPRITKEGHIHPESPRDMGSTGREEQLQLPKGQALTTLSRQAEAGRARQELLEVSLCESFSEGREPRHFPQGAVQPALLCRRLPAPGLTLQQAHHKAGS